MIKNVVKRLLRWTYGLNQNPINRQQKREFKKELRKHG